jgi:hypothetical protein
LFSIFFLFIFLSFSFFIFHNLVESFGKNELSIVQTSISYNSVLPKEDEGWGGGG